MFGLLKKLKEKREEEKSEQEEKEKEEALGTARAAAIISTKACTARPAAI